MKKLFDELSFQVSRETTRKYSTSFSLGILALRADIRPAIYAIYGFVRLADEIVDSFHGYDKGTLIARLRRQTEEAIAEKIAINPILQSFQETVHQYQIEWELIDTFLKSMEMDLQQVEYNRALYDQYILGSAEVVGLMCLHVFVHGNKTEYQRLKPYAMKLGAAFQKVNFLRDLKADFQVLGRTYFPNVNMQDFNSHTKAAIEQEIEQDFREALAGIRTLPACSKMGVYLAYTYYYTLFKKIRAIAPKEIIHQRIRINNTRKLSLMMSSYLQCKMALI
jgi:phytoene/squalene synthetase